MATYNLHSGHNWHVQGANGLLNETAEDRNVKNKLIELLRNEGHTVYDCTDEDATSVNGNLYNIVQMCNEHDVDLDISIHLNAGGGTGVEVWCYDGGTASEADKICKAISNTLGIRNRGVKYSQGLYVLSNTSNPALLIECAFVDNDTDYNAWSATKCAEAIYSALTGKSVNKAEWKHDSKGWWYKYADGSYPTSKWIQLDAWYYFDDKGYALENTWFDYKGKRYRFDKNCRMIIGWTKVDDKWYCMDKDGAMMINQWKFYQGAWYCLGPDGIMMTGLINENGNNYLLDNDGKMVKGWYKTDDERGEWLYFNVNKNCQPIGSMLFNHWHDGYYLKNDGTMAHDETLDIGGHKYTFRNDGKVAKTVLA